MRATEPGAADDSAGCDGDCQAPHAGRESDVVEVVGAVVQRVFENDASAGDAARQGAGRDGADARAGGVEGEAVPIAGGWVEGARVGREDPGLRGRHRQRGGLAEPVRAVHLHGKPGFEIVRIVSWPDVGVERQRRRIGRSEYRKRHPRGPAIKLAGGVEERGNRHVAGGLPREHRAVTTGELKEPERVVRNQIRPAHRSYRDVRAVALVGESLLIDERLGVGWGGSEHGAGTTTSKSRANGSRHTCSWQSHRSGFRWRRC